MTRAPVGSGLLTVIGREDLKAADQAREAERLRIARELIVLGTVEPAQVRRICGLSVSDYGRLAGQVGEFAR